MLGGEYGTLVQKCMQVLTTLGDIYEAENMLEIQNVHTPGVSYRVAGDAGLDYVREASCQGNFAVPVTLNTGGIDAENWREIGFPEDFALNQLELNKAYEKMGGIPTYTCTPYLTGNLPLKGEHIAWGESSAIVFANSVLGARTNREGGPSALAAAVTARVPAYGYHLDKNRRANWAVKVEMPLKTDRDYAVLGYHVGHIVGNGVPLFMGMKRPRLESLKAMGAALASSGGVALYHVEGVTPECPSREAVYADSYETISFGRREYDEVVQKFKLNSPADLVVVGCPHCSINEMREIAQSLDGKKLKTDLWICVSGPVYALAERSGYIDIIKKAGATLIRDTCPILCPTSNKGYKAVSTNSGKLAHYIRGLWDVDSELAQFEDCIDVALTGQIRGTR
jgi:predicted aconitase